MFSLIPKEVRFYDYFEQQSKHILNAAALLHDLCHNFSDARAKTHKIKEVEHAGDQVTHEIVKKLNTTFITRSIARTSTTLPRGWTTCSTTSRRPPSASSSIGSRSRPPPAGPWPT